MYQAKQIINKIKEAIDFSIGDTVCYNKNFLTSVNALKSKHIEGKVTGVEPTGHGTFIYVTWSDSKKTKSLASNLEVVS